MVDWREATYHPLRDMAEEMMADRLECLRGKTVRYRSLWSDGEKFDATVTLVRLDEIRPGDTFWVPEHGPVTAARTCTTDVETEIVDADRWETIAGTRLRLVALVSRNDGRAVEQRFVALPGGRSGREDWLVDETAA